jgi:hypothetical protein
MSRTREVRHDFMYVGRAFHIDFEGTVNERKFRVIMSTRRIEIGLGSAGEDDSLFLRCKN